MELVAELSVAAKRTPPALDDAMKTRLTNESWAGNVRELRNVRERAMILADGPVLKAEHFWIDDESASSPRPVQATTSTGSLADLEKQTIERTLAEELKKYDLR